MDDFTPEGEQEAPPSVSSRWEADAEHQWIYGGHPELTSERKTRLREVLLQEQGAFAYSLNDLPGYSGELGDVVIKMKHDKPIWTPERKHSPLELQIGDEKVGEMLAAGIISQISTLGAKYASAVTMPAKKAPDGTWSDKRFCCDSRRVNEAQVVDKHAMPLPEELFRRVQGARWISKLDCRSGFFNLRLSEESKAITAFWWRGKLYAFNRVPFGNVNSTAWFQKVMDHEIKAAGLAHCCFAFVDDVLIATETYEEHMQALQTLLRRFKQVGLRAHPAKSILCGDAMPYLGHVVSAEGMQPEDAKVAAIQNLPTPKNAEQVRSFLGVIGFYRCYVPGYSQISKPLTALTKKNAVFEWSEQCEGAYTRLKQSLLTPGIMLRHPNPDPSHTYHLYTDWSTNGIAAVLNQKEPGPNGKEYMIACVSRSLNEHEQRYEAWKGEMLAAVWGVKMMRVYLHGVQHFYLHTDHRPLLWLLTAREPTGQQARWVLSLQDYNFSLVHRPGSGNIADLPSRFPAATAVDVTGARLNASGEPLQYPLPRVFKADGTLDSTEYTHELLCEQKHDRVPRTPHPVAAALFAFDHHVQHPSQLRHQLLEFAAACQSDCMDVFAPTTAALLSGHNGSFADRCEHTADDRHAFAAWRQEHLAKVAQGWVAQAAPRLAQTGDPPSRPGQHVGECDVHGVKHTSHLCCDSVAATFFAAAAAQPIVLLEPFGGLCAGLEMALRNGNAIKQYYYLDTNHVARRVAAHRISQLMAQYPTLLPASAVQNAFSLPQDIRDLTTEQLVAVGAQDSPHQWLVVAGWPCQDMSLAGKAAGLRGERASLLFQLVRVIGALQQLQQKLPPGYIIENVPFQHHKDSNISKADFQTVCAMIGTPTVIDAAQFGSLAHRVRNYWTNLCTQPQLSTVVAQVERPPNRTVSLALGPGRAPQPVKTADKPPRYCCNVPGEPMQAWPTLVAHLRSYAFRPGEPGSVSTAAGEYDQPTATEREFALGYPRDSTAAPSVTEQQRCKLLGECMDANVMQCLYAIATAWGNKPSNQQASTAAKQPAQTAEQSYTTACTVAFAAAAQEKLQGATKSASTDIWHDKSTLHMLQHGTLPEGTTAAERSRINKRLAYYKWADNKLYRCMPDGAVKQVPAPEDRLQLVKQMHERCGHFGARRTAALVLNSHWWHGLQADVAHLVSACKECSRVKATFNAADPAELQPLPIMGLGYRWGVDLAGPFPETARGNRYIMVCVEHFSKMIEALPIPDKTPECTAYAFLHNVLARYGACAECVHDNGAEWSGGAFQQLLQDALIDSRHTSANHPQANGMTERCVQTIKTALKAMCSGKHNTKDWDLELPWLLLGYRCSPQRSTGFSPYQLLYAQQPVIPPAIVDRLSEPIDFDCPKRAAANLAHRRQLVRRMCPEALQNLQIAQHRDELRYAHTRSGNCLPKKHKFEVGDFVYTHQPNTANALQPKAKACIYRVTEVRPSGRLILQGKCGRLTDRHVSQCAPCHLPNIDPSTDPTLADKPVDTPCEVCFSPQSMQDNKILLCDCCDAGYHMQCLPQQLAAVPGSDWMCPRCVQAGVTPVELQAAVAARQHKAQARGSAPNLYPNKQMRERDSAAQQLHGRLILQNFVDRVTGRLRPFWGRVHYMGEQRRPRYFDVHFDDGDVYEYTTAEVKKHLQPVGTRLPAGVTLPNDKEFAHEAAAELAASTARGRKQCTQGQG